VAPDATKPDDTVMTYYADDVNDWEVWKLDDDSDAPFCTYDKTYWDPNVSEYLSIY